MSILRCPVCDGSGLVSRPPWVAADQEIWTSTSAGPFECPHCKGQRVVFAATGRPPL